MHTEIHGLNAVALNMAEADTNELFDVLGIIPELCESKVFGNAIKYRYSFGKGNGESFFLRYKITTGFVMLILHGSFFDNSPNFRLKKLLKFLSRFNHKLTQLDVAFTDDKKLLTLKDVLFWCRFSDDYCTGSLVRLSAPDILFRKRKFLRVQLGSAGSKTNYGTIYRRPDTRFIRIEIKFRAKEKIDYILENYSGKNLEQFNTRSLESLVSCINFITPRSKKNRIASKYKKQPAWEAFLGSDVKKIKWSEVHRMKRENRQQSDNEFIDKKIRRQATMVNNMLNKASIILSEKEALNQFANYSGYILMKKEVS